jgi:hypothetical protein
MATIRRVGLNGRTRPATGTQTAYINLKSEVWKHLNHQKTLLSADELLSHIGEGWLEMVKAEKADAEEQKDLTELERMFRLEDPRR